MAQIGYFGDGKAADDSSAPQSGLVQNVCRQWIVHEDEGLAHRLQKEEFQSHFGNNKEQRRVIRGDIKEAKIAYSEELTEIERQRQRHLQHLREMEQRDQELAEVLQKKLAEEEQQNQTRRRDRDEEMALELQLQEQEKSRRTGEEPSRRPPVVPAEIDPQEKFQRLKQRPSQAFSSKSRKFPVQDVFSTHLASKLSFNQEEERRKQEIEDEKLARQLQEIEHEAVIVKDDHTLAMESQDAEYARVLEEKEKDRLKKLQEKRREKKLSAESGLSQSGGEICGRSDAIVYPDRYHPTSSPPRMRHNQPGNWINDFADVSIVPRTSDTAAQKVRVAQTNQPQSAPITNVATLIDPTYRPNQLEAVHLRAAPGSSSTTRLPESRQTVSTSSATAGEDSYWEATEAHPPYMPMSQQRKTASLENQARGRSNKQAVEQVSDKNAKGKDKDSCKTQ